MFAYGGRGHHPLRKGQGPDLLNPISHMAWWPFQPTHDIETLRAVERYRVTVKEIRHNSIVAVGGELVSNTSSTVSLKMSNKGYILRTVEH